MRIVARARRKSRRSPARPDRDFDRAVAEFFMRIALAEARKGLGRTSPNPAVGAVLVKNGRIIARGHHKKAGGPHAEIWALRAAGARARGADLYSTLEPCDHHGKTPPCTQAIVEAGIRRVFVGCRDQNPIVSGRGLQRLKRAGIPVVSGVLEKEAEALNKGFFTFITLKRPYVTLKVASTADGRIATANGDSKWITGEQARARVHALRDRVDAILVGAGTVRADDPSLTARPKGRVSKRQPLRVVLSASLGLDPNATLFNDGLGPVLVFTADASGKVADALRARGVELVEVPVRRGALVLGAALQHLARRNVVHLLVEGGAKVYAAFLEAGFVDEVWLFLAPKILGHGVSWASLAPKRRIADALQLEQATAENVGDDFLIVGKPARPSGR